MQTGHATTEGAEADAFREPDDLESRLISVATTLPQLGGGLVTDLPINQYNTVKFATTPIASEGTIRWTPEISRSSFHPIGGIPQPANDWALNLPTDGPTTQITASAWTTRDDTSIRWVDAILVEASVDPHESSLIIVLKTSSLCTDHRSHGTTRFAYQVRAVMAMRLEEEIMCTIPACRAWDGTFDRQHQEPHDLVMEVLQQSLVAKHAYNPTPTDDSRRDMAIHVELLCLEEFLGKLVHP